MNYKAKKHSTAWRFGRWVGERHRVLRRQEARAVHWMAGGDVPLGLARAVPWGIKIVLLLALLYVAFWLALLLVCIAVAAWVAGHADADQADEWAIGEQTEHKNNPGYLR